MDRFGRIAVNKEKNLSQASFKVDLSNKDGENSSSVVSEMDDDEGD